jgi:hypothetical protein
LYEGEVNLEAVLDKGEAILDKGQANLEAILYIGKANLPPWEESV